MMGNGRLAAQHAKSIAEPVRSAPISLRNANRYRGNEAGYQSETASTTRSGRGPAGISLYDRHGHQMSVTFRSNRHAAGSTGAVGKDKLDERLRACRPPSSRSAG